MKLKIALVETEGTQFGLAVVSEATLDNPHYQEKVHAYYARRIFRDLPVVLVGENFLSAPRFFGPKELSDFMEGVRMEMIEWTELDLPHLPESEAAE
jgi:hypothetical protein